MVISSERLGGLLARNALVNLVGQSVPIAVGFFTTPFILRGLGTERFGILALVWMVLGYFALADLGLGRAATKFVAEMSGNGEDHRIPGVVWTALCLQLMLGIIACLVLIVLTPYLAEKVLKIPVELRREAKSSFYLVSLLIPIALCSATLRGILEARQRFDLENVVKAPSQALNFLLPAAGALLGFRLPTIVILLLIKEMGSTFLYLLLCFRIVPVLRQTFSVKRSAVNRLLAYGSSVTVANLASAFIIPLDRLVIGALLPLSAMSHYVVPQSVTPVLSVLSNSINLTLFPASSAMGASRKEKLERVSSQALKFLMLLQGPVIILVVLFAKDLLRLWVGPEFAEGDSTLVLQILTIGFFVNSIAAVHSPLLYGLGRPDTVARILLLELPVYLGFAWLLTKEMGIVGTAMAWALRGAFESALFVLAAWKTIGLSPRIFTNNGLPKVAVLLGALASASYMAAAGFQESKLAQLSAALALMVMFFGLIWYVGLSIEERGALLNVLPRFRYGTKVARLLALPLIEQQLIAQKPLAADDER